MCERARDHNLLHYAHGLPTTPMALWPVDASLTLSWEICRAKSALDTYLVSVRGVAEQQGSLVAVDSLPDCWEAGRTPCKAFPPPARHV